MKCKLWWIVCLLSSSRSHERSSRSNFVFVASVAYEKKVTTGEERDEKAAVSADTYVAGIFFNKRKRFASLSMWTKYSMLKEKNRYFKI
jgi:hypothetical protein